MILGTIETIIVLMVVAGATWFAKGQLGEQKIKNCNPVPLTSEVKTYIDAQLTRPGVTPCAVLTKLLSQAANLELKLSSADVLNQNLIRLREKRAAQQAAVINFRRTALDAHVKARPGEVRRIVLEAPKFCPSAPPAGRREESETDVSPSNISPSDLTPLIPPAIGEAPKPAN